jgi:hypothetical protein
MNQSGNIPILGLLIQRINVGLKRSAGFLVWKVAYVLPYKRLFANF